METQFLTLRLKFRIGSNTFIALEDFRKENFMATKLEKLEVGLKKAIQKRDKWDARAK